MNTFIHIGLSRTGTSFLQQNLFEESSDFLNIGLPHRYFRNDKSFIQIIKNKNQFFNQIQNLQSKTQAKCCVLSDDILAGGDRSLMEQLWVARNVSMIFPNANILITIREQMDLLKSYYKHSYGLRGLSIGIPNTIANRVGYLLSFEEWLTIANMIKPKGFLSLLEYDELASIWEYFFPQKVYILPLELLKEKDIYAENLSTFCGVEKDRILPFLLKEKINSSANKKDEYITQRPLKKVMAYLTKKYLFYNRVISQPDIESIVQSSFVNSNKLLNKKYGLNLANLNYFRD